MIFNEHFPLVGKHAFLSASKYHWINYTDEKLDSTFIAAMAAQKGTELHAFAAEAIRLRVKLQGRGTIAKYVNDCIGWKMRPEQVLFYSENAFGTPDAISFRKGVLRISDLKTGVTPTSEKQLMVYAAFFCLEYRYKPHEIEMELRIYQNDEVREYFPEAEDILFIMDRIVTSDKRIKQMREEAMD